MMERSDKRSIKGGGFNSWINKGVQWLATLLQARISHLSLAWQKRLLMLYCVIAIGISAGVSYCSLIQHSKTGMTVTPIRVVPLPQPVPSAPIISKEEYHRIRQWRLQWDSINGVVNQAGERQTLGNAWTLRDTLLYLEDLYHQQFK